eukprot:TRINITY_DN2061_c0_g1_i1.p1 TRINITY_DN2061_c0_g1~~TRINITY_DN2061_c0_g1_i1.p1  ORF type:complete len:313 (-),score=68.29 TRINITY_DN2061_c0_g1_i1:1950-2888(-)
MRSLPPEVWVYIASFLPKEKLRLLNELSKQWKKRVLYASSNLVVQLRKRTQELKNQIEAASKPEKKEDKSLPAAYNQRLLRIVQDHLHVTSLSLSSLLLEGNSEEEKISFNSLHALFPLCPLLKNLILTNIALDIKRLIPILPKTLVALSIAFNEASFFKLSSFFTNLPLLQKLEISGAQFEEEKETFSAASHRLSKLRLTFCTLPTNMPKEISSLPLLEYLDLSFSKPLFGSWVSIFSPLVQAYIWEDCAMDDQEVEAMCQKSKGNIAINCRYLQCLSVMSCESFTEEGFKWISAGCPFLQTQRQSCGGCD